MNKEIYWSLYGTLIVLGLIHIFSILYGNYQINTDIWNFEFLSLIAEFSIFIILIINSPNDAISENTK